MAPLLLSIEVPAYCDFNTESVKRLPIAQCYTITYLPRLPIILYYTQYSTFHRLPITLCTYHYKCDTSHYAGGNPCTVLCLASRFVHNFIKHNLCIKKWIQMGISMGNTYFHVFDQYSAVCLHKIVCLLTFLLVSNNFNVKNVNKQVQKCKQIHILLKIVQMNAKEILKKN